MFSMKGYGENVLTFSSGLTEVGVPVMIEDYGALTDAAADKDFIGFITSADGEVTGVIMDGYVEVPYTGTAPALGFSVLVSNGSKGVKVPSSGVSSNHIVRVLKVDTENKIVGFIL